MYMLDPLTLSYGLHYSRLKSAWINKYPKFKPGILEINCLQVGTRRNVEQMHIMHAENSAL